MKNSILYCINHPDCACGGLCTDPSTLVTPLATG
jgi:hypothetical protein